LKSRASVQEANRDVGLLALLVRAKAMSLSSNRCSFETDCHGAIRAGISTWTDGAKSASFPDVTDAALHCGIDLSQRLARSRG
jgi:hypothetical protein